MHHHNLITIISNLSFIIRMMVLSMTWRKCSEEQLTTNELTLRTKLTEVGISNRKQESKKTRKPAFDQESAQEKKKENTLSTKKGIKKKKEKKKTKTRSRPRKRPKNFLFFLIVFLGGFFVESVCSFFLFYLTFLFLV